MIRSLVLSNKQYTVQSAIDKLHGIPRPGQRVRIARGHLADGRQYRLYLCNVSNRLGFELYTHSEMEA